MTQVKKTLNDAARENQPFWNPLLNSIKAENRYSVKIQVNFQFPGSTVQEPAVNMYENQLDAGLPVYIELVDFNKDLIHTDVRTLFEIIPDKNWRNMPQMYAVNNYTMGGVSKTSYMVRLADLTEYNKTHSGYSSAVFEVNGTAQVHPSMNMPQGSGSSSPMPANNSFFSSANGMNIPPSAATVKSTPTINAGPGLQIEQDSSDPDGHWTQTTIRDIYAMFQNKPVSNKEWLNNLISKNQ